MPNAVRTNLARAVIQAQSSADSVVNVAKSTISEYARLYSTVQRLKYDTAGNVTDVTPAEELTVPSSAISSLKQAMNDLNKLIVWYNSLPDVFNVTGNGQGFYAGPDTSKIRFLFSVHSGISTHCSTIIRRGDNDLFGFSYYNAVPQGGARHIVGLHLHKQGDTTLCHAVHGTAYPTGCTATAVGNDLYTLDMDINEFDTAYPATILNKSIDEIVRTDLPSDCQVYWPDGELINYGIGTQDAGAVTITAYIRDILAAVIEPYNGLISAIENL